jgi:hypothetical protein
MVRESEHSKPHALVEFSEIVPRAEVVAKEIIPSILPRLNGLYKDDGFPPATNGSLFEEFVKDTGKYSAISSSKQQPQSAVLDVLLRRCGTEDV